MSVLARIKEIIATMADGHHKALEHVASELDALKEHGVPAADLEKIAASFDERVNAFLKNIAEDVGVRLATLEEAMRELQRRFPPPQPGSIAAAVADEPGGMQPPGAEPAKPEHGEGGNGTQQSPDEAGSAATAQ